MQDNILQWATVIVAVVVAFISLVGNIMQFFFSPKTPKTTAELELSQTLKTITEAYDKLFANLKSEIEGFEEELKLNNKIIEELTLVKIDLEAKVQRQEIQLKAQRKEIDKLKKQVAELSKINTQLNS